MKKILIVAALAAHGALTVAAVLKFGYWGVFEHQFQNLAGWQVLADLGLALMLVLVWLWQDARARGRSPLPWALFTLVAGSIAPLLYLLTQREPAGESRAQALAGHRA